MPSLDPKLVLASASPRRAELLERAGYVFDIIPAAVDESRRQMESVCDYVRRLALEKSEAVASNHRDRVVIGADTVVSIDRVMLGKPQDIADAIRMLKLLAGRTHEVTTGLALRLGETYLAATEVTSVSFTGISDDLIGWYASTGEPIDKAGAYGVQGIASRFVTRIEGSYTNVVGLPIELVERLLRKLVTSPIQNF